MSQSVRHTDISFETKERATLVKRGRTVIGRMVLKESSGKLHYYSNRRGNHIFLHGMPSVMVAKKKRVAAWGMDVTLVRHLKKLGVKRTHMLWKDGTTMKDFSCGISKWENGDVDNFGHAPQYFLTFDEFVVRNVKTREILRPWR